MKKLIAYVSGKIQKVGYRARVVEMARLLGLKGNVQNLEDGRVKIIAEGEESDLERFIKAIDIKNTVIRVGSITTEYTNPTGDFDNFYKQVDPGETDSRLDHGVIVLKEILGAIQDMNADIRGMGADIKGISTDIKGISTDIKGISTDIKGISTDIKDMNKNIGTKIDDVRADIVGEIRELRKDLNRDEMAEVKGDIAAIKAKLGL